MPNHGTANAILPGRRKQVEAGADYFLSKRTDVYLVVAYQRAAAGSVAALYPVGNAGGRNQTAVNLGLRHTF
ncbi:porin family protein [Chitinasiproducens palmae]|uniref:hypothetical protein n=1 Tax=Chitinasiproducens palmae TaxID=1770053 RepID=UPI001F40A1E3|nr:hypothetical protein [Chitinasiproducens palmae]